MDISIIIKVIKKKTTTKKTQLTSLTLKIEFSKIFKSIYFLMVNGLNSPDIKPLGENMRPVA